MGDDKDKYDDGDDSTGPEDLPLVIPAMFSFVGVDAVVVVVLVLVAAACANDVLGVYTSTEYGLGPASAATSTCETCAFMHGTLSLSFTLSLSVSLYWGISLPGTTTAVR